MTRVQVDWLSLLLSPILVVALMCAFFAARAAKKRGEPMPGWAKAAQGVGVALAMFVGLIHVAWGGE